MVSGCSHQSSVLPLSCCSGSWHQSFFTLIRSFWDEFTRWHHVPIPCAWTFRVRSSSTNRVLLPQAERHLEIVSVPQVLTCFDGLCWCCRQIRRKRCPSHTLLVPCVCELMKLSPSPCRFQSGT